MVSSSRCVSVPLRLLKSGKRPLKRLSDKSSMIKLDIFASCAGGAPVNWFQFRRSSCRLVNPPKELGMVPL